MNLAALTEIRHAAIGLPVGANVSIDCPFCKGGANRDRRTCSVGRVAPDSVAYICHRAKCEEARDGGHVPYGGGGGFAQQIHQPERRDEFVPRVYSGAIEELPDELSAKFTDKYGLSPETCRANIGWDSPSKRAVWKIVSPAGAVRGYELRYCFGTPGPNWTKSVPYRHSPSPWIGYFWDEGTSFGRSDSSVWEARREKPLFAVEDVVSALKVSRIVPSCSLMGTGLTFEKVVELGGVSKNIVLALDLDATEKARSLISRYSFILPQVKILCLRRDMKYWSYKDIEEVAQLAGGR